MSIKRRIAKRVFKRFARKSTTVTSFTGKAMSSAQKRALAKAIKASALSRRNKRRLTKALANTSSAYMSKRGKIKVAKSLSTFSTKRLSKGQMTKFAQISTDALIDINPRQIKKAVKQATGAMELIELSTSTKLNRKLLKKYGTKQMIKADTARRVRNLKRGAVALAGATTLIAGGVQANKLKNSLTAKYSKGIKKAKSQ